MTTSIEATVNAIKQNQTQVNRSLRALNAELEQENMLMADTPKGRVQRVLKVFRGIKPLLTVVSALPILPSTWRSGIVVFIQALDSLAAIDVTVAFKAGKDLEPAA